MLSAKRMENKFGSANLNTATPLHWVPYILQLLHRHSFNSVTSRVWSSDYKL